MSPYSPARLRDALASDEIVPYFQPLVEMRTGHLSGFEVLARWNHPDDGQVQPNDFIPLAEESGLIGMLTERMLVQAFREIDGLPSHLSLAINVSPVSLRDRSLPELVAESARLGKFNLSQLTIEITESALVHNIENAQAVTGLLKAMGARLAIDDFGTGYSSLRNLQAITFDEIKVDASFVRYMAYRRDCRKIVAAVIGLGQSLGMVTIAEGIEDSEQADMLVRLGCDLGQGWLYGHPMQAEEMRTLLEKERAQRAPSFPPQGNTEISAASVRLESLPGQRLPQLQALYDGAPVGLCLLDRDLRYVSLNKRLAEINHRPLSSHLGRTVKEVMPEVFEKVEPYLKQALQGVSVSGLEVFGVKADANGNVSNEERSVSLVSFEPVQDEAGEIVAVSASVADITELRQVKDALDASEDHYRHLVLLNPQLMWTADTDGRIVEASPRWEELTGVPVEDALGDGWIASLHPDDVAPTVATWEQALKTGEPLDVEYRVRLKGGGWLWVRVRAAARRGPDGEIMRWYGILENIDDLKKAVEALRQSEMRLQTVLSALQSGTLPEEVLCSMELPAAQDELAVTGEARLKG